MPINVYTPSFSAALSWFDPFPTDNRLARKRWNAARNAEPKDSTYHNFPL